MLTDYLIEKMREITGNTEQELEGYFAVRMEFFAKYPVYQRIFCEAVIAPPSHLKGEIQKRKSAFDRLNVQILEQLLAPIPLRPQVSRAEVIDTFRQFQDFINAKYHIAKQSASEFEAHEESCRRALNILLYGVIERKE